MPEDFQEEDDMTYRPADPSANLVVLIPQIKHNVLHLKLLSLKYLQIIVDAHVDNKKEFKMHVGPMKVLINEYLNCSTEKEVMIALVKLFERFKGYLEDAFAITRFERAIEETLFEKFFTREMGREQSEMMTDTLSTISKSQQRKTMLKESRFKFKAGSIGTSPLKTPAGDGSVDDPIQLNMTNSNVAEDEATPKVEKQQQTQETIEEIFCSGMISLL